MNKNYQLNKKCVQEKQVLIQLLEYIKKKKFKYNKNLN